MKNLLSALRQIEPFGSEAIAQTLVRTPMAGADMNVAAHGAVELAQGPLIEWPAKLLNDKTPTRHGQPTVPRARKLSATGADGSADPIVMLAPVGVVTAAAVADPDVFVCLSTLDSMLESALAVNGESPPWSIETIDLSPATVMDLRRAARAANRRGGPAETEVRPAAGKPLNLDARSPIAAALEFGIEHSPTATAPVQPSPSPAFGEHCAAPLSAEQCLAPASAQPVKPRPLPGRGRDFIYKAMEKHLASEESLAAQPAVRSAVKMQASQPRAIEPQAPSGAEIVDQTWAASLVENTDPSPVGLATVKQDKGKLALPAQDLDRRSRYWRIAKRLMAPRNGYRAEKGVIVLLVAAGRVGAHEFSMIEMARASLEAVSGRVLLVALDGSTEFLPGVPAGLSLGLVDVWRGAASWADTIRTTSDPRIDLIPWGSSAPAPAAGFSCDELRTDYSLILLAGGGKIAGAVESVASKVDDVLMVVALGNTRTEVALGMSSRLAALRAPLTGCVVVGAAE